MPRKSEFAGGHRDADGTSYSLIPSADGSISVEANNSKTGAKSSASFYYDTDTKAHEVVPGTLNLHPEHQEKGVGRTMRRLVNSRF
jgi:hypothetical protein